MDCTRLSLGTFLRVTSISVAVYDYLITIPAEWRIYRTEGSMPFGLSISKILFILIRYVSVLLLTISDLGYYYHGFSPASCSNYYMIAPAVKVIQIMISQTIIGCRTWAITRQSKKLGIFLLGLGLIVTALEWYTSVSGRELRQVEGNCAPATTKSGVPPWVFYFVAMVFDAVTCILSTVFLVRSAGGIRSMSMMFKMLFYDGLGYMVVLTAVNILNLNLFLISAGKSEQAWGASFGYMVVWITSQRILIHIHDAAEERAHQGVFVSHQITAPRDGSLVVRNRFGSSMKDGTETTIGGLGVQVEIEQTASVDYSPVYGREDCRKPWVV